MVSINQIEKGIASYLDAELMPKFPQTGLERVLIGTGVSLLVKKNVKRISELQQNPIVGAMGIFDGEGNVDLDMLRDEVKKNITTEGIQVDAPMIGKLTFHKDDIDKLYNHITAIGG